MSGSVSSAQFNFVPRASGADLSDNTKPSLFGMGEAGREYTGTRSLAPIASGAFSSQDQALAFRHQGGSALSSGAKYIGSWLFKSE